MINCHIHTTPIPTNYSKKNWFFFLLLLWFLERFFDSFWLFRSYECGCEYVWLHNRLTTIYGTFVFYTHKMRRLLSFNFLPIPLNFLFSFSLSLLFFINVFQFKYYCIRNFFCYWFHFLFEDPIFGCNSWHCWQLLHVVNKNLTITKLAEFCHI